MIIDELNALIVIFLVNNNFIILIEIHLIEYIWA